MGFRGASQCLRSKESTCKPEAAGGTCSIPESGSSFGGESGNPHQHSCLENFMERGDWWAKSIGLQRV